MILKFAQCVRELSVAIEINQLVVPPFLVIKDTSPTMLLSQLAQKVNLTLQLLGSHLITQVTQLKQHLIVINHV
jgi:hypothetical protein